MMVRFNPSLCDREAGVSVRAATDDDRHWIAEVIRERWRDTRIAARGVLYDTLQLGALVSETDGHPSGLLTYAQHGDECEIVTLDALQSGCGVGTQLIEHLADGARACGMRILALVTTNDNVDALRFYQRRGFVISRVWPNGQEQNRQLKPSIPKFGCHGIPIRDEIELVRAL